MQAGNDLSNLPHKPLTARPNKSYLPMTVFNQTADIEIDNFVFNLSVHVVCLQNLVLARAYTYTALYLILFLQTVGAYSCTRFQLPYQAGDIYSCTRFQLLL